jgi:hypothetical protein
VGALRNAELDAPTASTVVVALLLFAGTLPPVDRVRATPRGKGAASNTPTPSLDRLAALPARSTAVTTQYTWPAADSRADTLVRSVALAARATAQGKE